MRDGVSEASAALRVGLLGDGPQDHRGIADAALEQLAAGLALDGGALDGGALDGRRPSLRPLRVGPGVGPGDLAGGTDRPAHTPAHRVEATCPADAPLAGPPDTIVLDGDPARPAAAWDAAAATVVRLSDVLLAVGDARTEPLAGAVRLATELGIPVLWLVAGEPARLVLHRGWQLDREALPEGPAAWDALLSRLRPMLAPAGPDAGGGLPSLDTILPTRRLWRTHHRVMQALWRMPAAPGGTTAGTTAPSADWVRLYEAADRLAAGYADRYRSAYTLVLCLAAVALVAAVLGLGLPLDEHGHPRIHPLWTAVPEAACLGAIVVLVWASTRFRWQSQLIAFRLLAELCRKQSALSLVARSLPAARIAHMTHGGDQGGGDQGGDDLGWVGRRFAAAVRAAPFPACVLAGPQLAQARDAAAEILLRGQRRYHAARAEASRLREHRLVRLGGWLFALTAVCVAVKLVLLAGGLDGAEAFGLVAALLPAGAAALFGLRAYAELELLVQTSEGVLVVLDAAAESLARTDTNRYGASQHVGDVLEQAALAMLSDIEGWIQISRVKAVEAG